MQIDISISKYCIFIRKYSLCIRTEDGEYLRGD